MHLQRHEGGGWVSLSANKAEAGEMVTELIGLNRAQFTQVMLLPQGQFAKFLQAADDERRVLLSKLFGTQLYDPITAELDRRRAAAVRQQGEAGEAIRTAVSAAAEAAGLDAAARAELLALPGAERATRLKQVAADLAEDRGGQRRGPGGGGGRDRRPAGRVRAGAAAGPPDDPADRGAAAAARARGTRPGHEQRAARLAAARRAEPVRPLLEAWRRPSGRPGDPRRPAPAGPGPGRARCWRAAAAPQAVRPG